MYTEGCITFIASRSSLFPESCVFCCSFKVAGEGESEGKKEYLPSADPKDGGAPSHHPEIMT